MLITSALKSPAAWLVLLLAPAVTLAQTASDHPLLDRQLERIDLGVSAAGIFSKNTSGNSYLPQLVQLSPSTTVGALVTLRYTKAPFFGFEFNYGYARYTDNFTVTNIAATPPGCTTTNRITCAFSLGVQTKAAEYTVGYVVHPRRIFNVQPFVAAGGGFIGFTPTSGGGEGVQSIARPTIYYNIGAEDTLYGHFGARVSFRQLFFTAPDFGQNYFNNNQRSITSEPTIGFFLKF